MRRDLIRNEARAAVVGVVSHMVDVMAFNFWYARSVATSSWRNLAMRLSNSSSQACSLMARMAPMASVISAIRLSFSPISRSCRILTWRMTTAFKGKAKRQTPRPPKAAYPNR